MRKKYFSWFLLVLFIVVFGLVQGSSLAQGTGEISGTVTNVIGTPLDGIEVWLYRQIGGEWTFDTYTTTDSSGNYALIGLDAESYRLQFKDWSQIYAYQFYDGASRLENGTDIPVAAGSVVTIDTTMELAGKISGTITDPNGQPLQFATLFVFEHGTDDPNSPLFVTQPGGINYEFGGLPTGDYVVKYTGVYNGQNYNEYYQDKYDFGTADPIPVVTGFTTDNINAVLGEPVSGEITGTVTGAGGPISGIEVSLRRYYSATGSWQLVEYLDTDGNGQYTFDELTPGTYRLHFNDWSQNYAFEYYDNAIRFEDSTDILVGQDEVVVMPDVVLESAGRITGTLTAPGGGLLDNAFVWVFLEEDERGNVLFFQNVVDGTYNIGGLPTGTYHVQFTGQQGPDNYNEYYDDQPDWDSADSVAVTAGQITTGINAELGNPPGGIISGSLTDIYGRAFDVGRVNAYTNISGTWQMVGTEPVYNADPTYEINLPPGTYRLEFEGLSFLNPGNPTSEVYDDVSSLAQGQDINLALGQTISGVDAAVGNYAIGSISGQVTDQGGSPLPGIEVYVYDRSLGLLWDQIVVTDSNGDYMVNGLWPESYFVEFYDPNGGYYSEYYGNSADPAGATQVLVTYNAVTGIDESLQAAPSGSLPGSVIGIVTDDSSNPLFGLSVTVREGATGDYAGRANTASDGSYRVRGLGSMTETVTYTVRFSDFNGNYVTEWFDNAASQNETTPITVTNGSTTAGIDAALLQAGKISGSVTNIYGGSFSILTVVAYQFDGPSGQWIAVASDAGINQTDYELEGLLPGDYRVVFNGSSFGGNGYVEFFDDVATIEDGTDVTVVAGQTTGGIDAVLGPDILGTISGSVTDGSGSPLAGITVRISGFDDIFYTEETTTLADGSYLFEDVYNGIYYVEFFDSTGTYPGEWYDDAPSANFATPIFVNDGPVTGIDAVLDGANGGPGGASISGTVTLDGSGTPLSNIEVSCYSQYYDPISNCQTTTDANGNYFLGGFLPEEAYLVRFEAPDGSAASEYYDDVATIDLATPITLTAGTTFPNVDASLAPAGYISGTISDQNGDPWPVQGVAAYRYDGTDWVFVNSESYVFSDEPDYLLGGLPAGTYRLRFSGGPIFIPPQFVEYYDDVQVIEAGTDVTVTVGQVTPNINAVLGNVYSGGISGRVTDANDNGLDLIRVVLYRDGIYREAVVTDSQGDYQFDQLPADNYQLEFFDLTGQYLTEFYDDQPDLASATAVSVSNSVVSGIDAQLSKQGKITGNVADLSGNPLDFVQVSALTFDGVDWVTAETAFADPAGDYTLDNLTPSTYRVEFMGYRVVPGGPPAMFVEYYDDEATVEAGSDIVVADGAVISSINAQLGNISPFGEISGKVMDMGGEALANVKVTVFIQEPSGQWIPFGEVTTNNVGDFSLEGMADSHYRLCFTDPAGYFNGECYDDVTNINQASDVVVEDGQITADINAWLEGDGPPETTYRIYMPMMAK